MLFGGSLAFSSLLIIRGEPVVLDKYLILYIAAEIAYFLLCVLNGGSVLFALLGVVCGVLLLGFERWDAKVAQRGMCFRAVGRNAFLIAVGAGILTVPYFVCG